MTTFFTTTCLTYSYPGSLYISYHLSILKYSVPEFIENNKDLTNLIIEITDARIEDGGSGAFYIYLKNKSNF